jgi:hypothetical protein
MHARGGLAALTIAAALVTGTLPAARPRELTLRETVLSLPGPPSAIVPADIDGDGRKDLVIVTAYTRWGSVARDRVEDAIEVTEVVPTLFDRREVRAFLAASDGAYRAVAPMPLPASWIAIAPGTAAHPVVALTEDGVDALVFHPGLEGGSLDATSLLAEPSALARGGAFLADVDFIDDVDGDGRPDAVVPAADGIAIHRGTTDGGFDPRASYRARLPGDRTTAFTGGAHRSVPIPSFVDLDADGKKDLVVPELEAAPQRITLARGLGEGRFGPVVSIRLGCLGSPPAAGGADEPATDGPPKLQRRVAWFGDLDADGRPELVTRETVDTGKSDRKQATSPVMRYRFHRVRPDLIVATEPYATLDAQGYAFTGAFRDGVDLEFLDLDGDGRKDLVTVTLDVSTWQLLRALSSKKLAVGLEFRVFAQGADGNFRIVPDQVLDEKLKFDLNRLEISRLGQFQGDFDGDGRIDFVHLGRGKSVTIHRGQAGGRYPAKPDLELTLSEEPQDVMLVRVRDFDGDGRSDLAVTRTSEAAEAGASAPVSLELHLSGGPR